MIDFINQYANLINTTLLIGIMIFIWRLFQITIKSKESQIETLKQQLELSKAFEIEEAVNKFQSLKKYYEEQREEWFQITLQKLNREKEEALTQKEIKLQSKLHDEIKELHIIKNELDSDTVINASEFDLDSIIGDYRVFGYNPYDVNNQNEYQGNLRLEKNKNTIKARWRFEQGKQGHEGVGMLKNNILGIQFWYKNLSDKIENGIVLYEFIGNNVIRGVWTGKGTNELGFEEGRKINRLIDNET